MTWYPVEDEGPEHSCQAAYEQTTESLNPILYRSVDMFGPSHYLCQEYITDDAVLVSCVACNKVWWEFEEDM